MRRLRWAAMLLALWARYGLAAPPPQGVSGVRIERDDAPLVDRPDGAAGRRGSASLGAVLPVLEVERGPGCDGFWLLVGQGGWLCQDRMRVVDSAPSSLGAKADDLSPRRFALRDQSPRRFALRDQSPRRFALRDEDGLPYRYFIAARDVVPTYRSLETTVSGPPLQRDFAVPIVEERQRGAVRYGRTRSGRWVSLADLRPAEPVRFAGAELTGDARALGRFGWVAGGADKVPIHGAPGGRPLMAAAATLDRLTQVPVLAERTTSGARWLLVGQGAWLPAQSVRRPTLARRPAEVPAGARWIDVDLATQTLVAYEGDQPVYATLVSTGRGPAGSPAETPRGLFRIWAKLRSATMDNVEYQSVGKHYSIEDAPYVQYFSKGVALHGAFWHSDFGSVRSHGCVNLSPLDARWLFRFTQPPLPPGWSAVLPQGAAERTYVRVR